MPKRRKPFTRIKSPKKLVPTEATTELLLGIYYHEGMLSQRQIISEFFPGKTNSWPETRLQQYFDHYLVNKFNAEWVNGEHLRETIYTLGTQGARFVARHLQVDYQSLTWRAKPRWLSLPHDLNLNDFRLAVSSETNRLPGFELVNWISEFELQQSYQKKARPDGFFLLRRISPTNQSRVEELAILVEVDNATHPLNRFVNRKVKPAMKYVASRDYQQIFGVPSGAYFILTTSPERLANLKEKIEEAGGQGRFYLSTADQMTEGVLTTPIWQMAGSDELLSIAEMPLKPRLRQGVHHAPQGQLSINTTMAI